MVDLFTDPFAVARQYLNRAAAEALDQAIVVAERAARRAVQNVTHSVAQQIEYITGVLGALPHATANMVADSFRGSLARPMTAGEIALVNNVFGRQPVAPRQVRFEPGPGRQGIALAAFIKGNPAITIGNTVFIKPAEYSKIGGKDLSKTPAGIEMLVHEYMHVIQYARLGFARFGQRYAREFRASGYDPGKMYAYGTRSLHYRDEMIEGQAAIVGHYAEQMALKPHERDGVLVRQLQSKLRGAGMFGL